VSSDLGPILIVDDDAAFRTLVAELLATAGMASIQAADGGEALELARKDRPALVVLDVRLPGVSGYEICRGLREEFGEELPVLFVSGDRTESLDRAVGLLLGGDDYVVKPFDPDELLARVRRLISRAQPYEVAPVAQPQERALTKRELDVLRGLAAGSTPADIAGELDISPKTVSNHVQNIFAKLGVHSRAQAVARAYELSLVGGSGGGAGGAAA
jgi:DNA-binding NarL/FixJ family response regulator